MTPRLVHYVPIATTVLSLIFAFLLLHRFWIRRSGPHLLWWAGGILCYGLGTAFESAITLTGNTSNLNKAWYIPDFMVIKELKDFVPSHGHELVLLEWKTRFGDVFDIPYDHSPRVIVVDQAGRIRKWYQGEMNDHALVEVINLVTDLNGKG